MILLGRPRSVVQLIACALTLPAYLFVRHWAGPLSTIQLFAILLILEFVVQPVSTLIHELGHAIAARGYGSPTAHVIVGRGPYMTFARGAVRVNFSALPTRGVIFRGLCTYNSSQMPWRSRAQISIAGPLATSLELCLVSVVTTIAWDSTSNGIRTLLLMTVIGLIASLLVNLIPIGATNDGSQARHAFELERTGAPLPAAPAPAAMPQPPAAMPQPPVAMPQPLAVMAPEAEAEAEAEAVSLELARDEREQDRARARTSVAPPTRV